jgi:hypothetical protein
MSVLLYSAAGFPLHIFRNVRSLARPCAMFHSSAFRVHFLQNCFVIRHQHLSLRLWLGLVLADFSLKLGVMVNERLHKILQ